MKGKLTPMSKEREKLGIGIGIWESLKPKRKEGELTLDFLSGVTSRVELLGAETWKIKYLVHLHIIRRTTTINT